MASSLPPAVSVFPGIQFNSNFYTPNEAPVSYEKVVESFVQYPVAQGDVSMQSAYFTGNVVVNGDVTVITDPILVDTIISDVESSIDASNNLVLSNTTNMVNTVIYNSIPRSSSMGVRALGAGLNDSSSVLLMNGSTLYAGGVFSGAGSGAASRVAQWNNGIWSAVGESPPAFANGVNSLCVVNGVLYAGGSGSVINGALYVVKFDGTRWSSLPNLSLSNTVLSLQYFGGFLYVGGVFTSPRSRILRYNLTTNAVDDTLPQLNSSVNCMTVANGNLVVGGSFTTLNRIAMLVNNVWTPLGGGITNNTLRCMAYDATRNLLYVGGDFTSPFSRTAVWNFTTSEWNSMYDLSYATGLNGVCFGMCLDEANNKLYVTGDFTNVGNRIAVWDGTTSRWSSFGNIGLNTVGRAIVKDTSTSLNRFYVCGHFTAAILTDTQTNQTVQQSSRYIAQIGELKPKVNMIVDNKEVASSSEGETKPILITGSNGYLLETVPSFAV